METEARDVLDKGEDEADTIAAGKVNLFPGILLLVLKPNCDCTGAPVGCCCTLPADLSGNIFALPSENLNPPAFFSVCSNTVGVGERLKGLLDCGIAGVDLNGVD